MRSIVLRLGGTSKKKYSFPAFNVFIVFTSQKAKSQKSRITKSHNKPTKQDHPDRLVLFFLPEYPWHLQITHARWPRRGRPLRAWYHARPLLTWAASIVPCFRDFSDHGG